MAEVKNNDKTRVLAYTQPLKAAHTCGYVRKATLASSERTGSMAEWKADIKYGWKESERKKSAFKS